MSPSMLSEVLSAKKALTRQSAEKLSSALGLSQSEADLFKLSQAHEKAAMPGEQAKIEDQINSYSCFGRVRKLAQSQSNFVSDPRHLVLLALMGVRSGKQGLTWLAKQLGCFQSEVNRLISTLKALNFVEAADSGELKLAHDYSFSKELHNPEAVKTFHRQTLTTALQSIDQDELSERDFYTSIFAIDQLDLPEMQKEVRDFHRTLYAKYARKLSADRVYSLQCQMIPQTPRILP